MGIGLGPAGTVGTTAAIKWITKDGLGAAGRLFVGGKLSSVFDEDPKRCGQGAGRGLGLGGACSTIRAGPCAMLCPILPGELELPGGRVRTPLLLQRFLRGYLCAWPAAGGA